MILMKTTKPNLSSSSPKLHNSFRDKQRRERERGKGRGYITNLKECNFEEDKFEFLNKLSESIK